jgi:acyl-CoA dehydrogenase
MRERCRIFIVMGKTDPEGPRYRQQSMILVPRETPGMTILRNLPVFGYIDPEGHAEILFDNARVPVSNLIGNEGDGFLISQARLGPGRIHHCMRAIGAAERALELMCRRARSRVTFGELVSDRANVQDWIAESRIDIEMARLLTMKTAWLMDTVGNKHARMEIAAIKVAAPNVALRVVDRAIQVHGGAGVSDDFPLAMMYAHLRTLRLADGPDEIHKRTMAREELRRMAGRDDAASPG